MKTIEDLLLEIKNLKDQLTAAHGEKAAELDKRISTMQRQVDAIDSRGREVVGRGSSIGGELNTLLEQNDGVMRLIQDKKGSAVITIPTHLIQRKTTLTETDAGAQTTGVMAIDRIPGIVPEARQRLFVRDLLPQRPTTLQIVDFVRVSTPLTKGSPQSESNDKHENAMVMVAYSEKVRTLATTIPASRQVLDDLSELMAFLQVGLPYYVSLEEELQLLSGDGTGENLHGITVQASAFNTSLLSGTAGWNKIDLIGRAIQQIAEAKELPPTFIVLNPRDWWSIRLTKDAYGRYILGDPMEPAGVPNLFGLLPVATTSMSQGSFLVGSGSPIAIEIRDRMSMVVEIATQHSDFFARNLIMIRAEARMALLVKRPGSFIYSNSFATSPAGY